MKIALLIYGSLDTISGGYLYDRKLVEHLRGCGDEVTIISLPWSNYGRHLSHNLSHGLYHQLRHASYDILLQDELNHPSLFWLNRRLRRHSNTPIVPIVHHLRASEQHPAWQLWFYRHIERLYLQTAAAFITNSHTTRRTVTQLLKYAKPTLVAYPGGDRLNFTVTPQVIGHRARRPGPLRLLFVGNLIPRKGLHDLVTAVSQLPSGSWRLDVVGNTAVSPAYTQTIQRQIQQPGLATAVTLHGPLPDHQLADLMQHSHLLVVPSTYEGFGIVYLEGMAAGLPAIATTAGAAHEIIRDGENGYLVEVGDTAVLTRHLYHLHHNRTHLAQMSRNALSYYQSHPTWHQSMSQIRHFLAELVSSVSLIRATN